MERIRPARGRGCTVCRARASFIERAAARAALEDLFNRDVSPRWWSVMVVFIIWQGNEDRSGFCGGASARGVMEV